MLPLAPRAPRPQQQAAAAVTAAGARPPAAGCSWLVAAARRLGSSDDVQLVPRLPQPAVPALHWSTSSSCARACEPRARARRVACAAAATAAAAAPGAAEAAPAPAQAAVAQHDTTRARLYALYDFVMVSGRVPTLQDSHKGVAVGQWAEDCRQAAQDGTLEQPLAAALDSVPGWTWEPQRQSLASRFDASLQWLRAYVLQHGMPPTRMVAKRVEHMALSDKQRQQIEATVLCREIMEQRKRGVLTTAQIHGLARDVPGWRWDPRIRSPPLDEVIAILEDFVQQHGRLPKQSERLPNGFQLGEWCTARRGEQLRGVLEPDVADAIARGVPGWTWNRHDDAFETGLAKLHEFAAAHGRMPTQREAWHGVRLGAWANKRRLQHKAGALAADRVAALEAVPGWWWSCEDMPLG